MKIQVEIKIDNQTIFKEVEVDDRVLKEKGYSPRNIIFSKAESILFDIVDVGYVVLDGKYKGCTQETFPIINPIPKCKECGHVLLNGTVESGE